VAKLGGKQSKQLANGYHLGFSNSDLFYTGFRNTREKASDFIYIKSLGGIERVINLWPIKSAIYGLFIL
jgi:hypothetical protein